MSVSPDSLETKRSCSRDFPGECYGCEHFRSGTNDKFSTILTGLFGLYAGPAMQYERCELFNFQTSHRTHMI